MEFTEIITNLHFKNENFAVLLPLILILIDFISGFINAWKNGNIDSSVMREGLGHKFAEIIYIVIGLLLDLFFGLHIVYLGFITYISLMEVVSIFENCSKLGISPEFIKNLLKNKGSEE